MKRYRLFFVALCLWLPLQTVAGELLHCDHDTPSQAGEMSHSGHEVEMKSSGKHPHGCQDAAGPAEEHGSSTSAHEDCEFCQLSCHLSSSLVHGGALIALPEQHLPQSNLTQTATSFFPDTPLRPPQFA